LKIFEDKDLQKLSVNSLIGMFGRTKNSFIQNEVCLKDNIEDFDAVYTKFQRPFINDINQDYSIITNKVNIDKMESAYPIYAQVLDCEAIELYEMVELLKENNAVPICVKTDAVVYFANSPLKIDNYYWDNDKTILKYK